MKKIFTLIAAALMAVGASAATETFSMATKWTATTVEQNGITVAFDDPVSNAQTGYFKFTKGHTLTISSSVGNITGLSINCTDGKLGKTNGTSVNTGTLTGAGTSTPITWEGDAASITITNAADGGGDMRIGSIVVTYTAGPIVAVDPVFSLTKTSINQYQSSQIVVNSKNGLDGLTMSGISYDGDIISINADGVITPVATGTSVIRFTTAATEKYNAGSANLSITVTNVTLDEGTNVSADATWDWSQFGTSQILLTDATTPAKGEEFVLSNIVKYGYCETIGTGFGDAQQLKVKCEYPVRDGKYLQGSSIKFTTLAPGKISVTYSNTGNRTNESDRRYLNVNGTNYGEGTMVSNATETTSDIEVEPGDVVISGRFLSAPDDDQFLRFYSITFTATGEPVAPTGINTVATDAAKANVVKKYVDGKQVVIEKNGKKYNVAGAQIK